MNQHERFARLRLILGDDGLAALSRSTVMVLGLGGVGSSCAEALARGGVGTLILIDEDDVTESNINRQALAFYSTLGRPKPAVMRDMIADINPDCTVYSQQAFISPTNVSELFTAFPRPDYVIDCIDTMSQKLAIAHWCTKHEVPLLSAMGAANKLDPTMLEFAEVQQTTHCPVAAVMRRECRVQGLENVEVIFSREPAIKVHHDGGRTKGETLGSMSYMPPIMGQMLAGMAIRRLAGLAPMAKPPQLRTKENEGMSKESSKKHAEQVNSERQL